MVLGGTNATVLAMEKVPRRCCGLGLLVDVTEANDQVRLSPRQLRSANAQVVETMEQHTDVSGQVSTAAGQIAAAAGSLAALARNLEDTATTVGAGQR